MGAIAGMSAIAGVGVKTGTGAGVGVGVGVGVAVGVPVGVGMGAIAGVAVGIGAGAGVGVPVGDGVGVPVGDGVGVPVGDGVGVPVGDGVGVPVGTGAGVGVGAGAGIGASGKLAARIVALERLFMVSMTPAPATVADAPKKSEITKSSVALAIPSLLMSTIRLVPCRPKPTVPAAKDRERLMLVPKPICTLSVPPVS